MSRFEICGTMGRGKYSEVYEGIEIETKAEVVIKFLKPGTKTKPLLTPSERSEDLKRGKNPRVHNWWQKLRLASCQVQERNNRRTGPGTLLNLFLPLGVRKGL